MALPGCGKRLAGSARHAQILEVAAALFARSGLHRTTTHAIAAAAGVTEPVLYDHFKDKECLFRKAVEFNSRTRLRKLDEDLASMVSSNQAKLVEALAEATVMACFCTGGHALLTAWALLETSGYAADLHRKEIASVEAMWGRELAERARSSPAVHPLPGSFLSYAVHACLSHGFWLAALRHTAESARAPARRFAADLARTAPGPHSS